MSVICETYKNYVLVNLNNCRILSVVRLLGHNDV